jgi:hypothetical protein
MTVNKNEGKYLFWNSLRTIYYSTAGNQWKSLDLKQNWVQKIIDGQNHLKMLVSLAHSHVTFSNYTIISQDQKFNFFSLRVCCSIPITITSKIVCIKYVLSACCRENFNTILFDNFVQSPHWIVFKKNKMVHNKVRWVASESASTIL